MSVPRQMKPRSRRADIPYDAIFARLDAGRTGWRVASAKLAAKRAADACADADRAAGRPAKKSPDCARGPMTILTKPFDFDELLARVARCTGGAAATTNQLADRIAFASIPQAGAVRNCGRAAFDQPRVRAAERAERPPRRCPARGPSCCFSTVWARLRGRAQHRRCLHRISARQNRSASRLWRADPDRARHRLPTDRRSPSSGERP